MGAHDRDGDSGVAYQECEDGKQDGRKSIATAASASMPFEGFPCFKQLNLTLTPPGDKFVTRIRLANPTSGRLHNKLVHCSNCVRSVSLQLSVALTHGSPFSSAALIDRYSGSGPRLLFAFFYASGSATALCCLR